MTNRLPITRWVNSRRTKLWSELRELFPDPERAWRLALDTFKRPGGMPDLAAVAWLLRSSPMPEWARSELAELFDPVLGVAAFRLSAKPVKPWNPRVWLLQKRRDVEIAVAVREAARLSRSVDDAAEEVGVRFRLSGRQVFKKWSKYKRLVEGNQDRPDLIDVILAAELEELLRAKTLDRWLHASNRKLVRSASDPSENGH